MAYSCSLAALGANKLYLGCVYRSLCLDDAALLAHSCRLYVLCDNVDSLNDNLVFLGAYFYDLASLSVALACVLILILSGEKDNSVTGFYVNFTHNRMTPPLKNFRSEAEDLGVLLFTELLSYGSKDTCTLGVLVFLDYYSSVLIETDICSVLSSETLC